MATTFKVPSSPSRSICNISDFLGALKNMENPKVAANENIKNWFDLLHTADEGIKKTLRYYYNLFDVNK